MHTLRARRRQLRPGADRGRVGSLVRAGAATSARPLAQTDRGDEADTSSSRSDRRSIDAVTPRHAEAAAHRRRLHRRRRGARSDIDLRRRARALHSRTAWHTHPHGQTIFVTEGVGQREGGPDRGIRPATASSSSPARTTGTAPPRTASWPTSPCSRTTRPAARSPGASTSPTSSTPAGGPHEPDLRLQRPGRARHRRRRRHGARHRPRLRRRRRRRRARRRQRGGAARRDRRADRRRPPGARRHLRRRRRGPGRRARRSHRRRVRPARHGVQQRRHHAPARRRRRRAGRALRPRHARSTCAASGPA